VMNFLFCFDFSLFGRACVCVRMACALYLHIMHMLLFYMLLLSFYVKIMVAYTCINARVVINKVCMSLLPSGY
jgi:hypothetical protein